MFSRRNGIIAATLAFIVIGFLLIKAPTPVISIAAEEIVDLGGYSITNTILSAWVVIVLMAILTFILYRRLRHVEEALVPRGFQNVIEALLEAFSDVVTLIAGEKNGRRFFPVVATIFIFLLFGNWFGLFPWNNAIGKIEDVRAEYLEELEEDAEDFLHDLPQGSISTTYIADVNDAFGAAFLGHIPVAAHDQKEANKLIEEALRGDSEEPIIAAVRAQFAANPIAQDTPAGALPGAIEERLRRAGIAEAEIEELIALNLPLPSSEVGETELEGAVINSGGVNIIPLRAEGFDYDPFVERVILPTNADAASARARLYDSSASAGLENRPANIDAGELEAPITVNTAHLGIVLKRQQEGLDAGEGIGAIFPFFRAIATDLNLTLAVALWAVIFVQLWGVQSLGLRTNFGRFVGVGSAAVVKGPIGAFVGFLEIISELARVVSFTFRLFGNILAGEIVLFMSAFLVPFLVATVFYGFEVFVGFIQAFVFAMLTLVFAVTAVSHGEHEEPHEEELEGGA